MTSLVRTGLLGVGLVAAAMVAAAALGQPLAPLPPLAAPKTEQVELGKHLPATGWGDGKPLSTGYPGSEYFRNAQTLLNAAHWSCPGLVDGFGLSATSWTGTG